LHAAENLFDAIITWELIANFSDSDVSLRFFQHFEQNVEIGTYRKGSDLQKPMGI